ncbi:hypothetical protein ACFFGH_10780 [Lysobacter korlensis]|uniref:Uncharacterized protein n=1 Tax=Lysobacter korlensis TaxID=553636 RepID=A0ABV6RP16_9GAMM
MSEVAASWYNILRASTDGFTATVTFISNSKKSKWRARYEFDEKTGDFVAYVSYYGAGVGFGRDTQERVRAVLAR